MRRNFTLITQALCVAALGFVLPTMLDLKSSKATAAGQIPPELRFRAQRDGSVRVIVELNLPSPHVPEGALSTAAAIVAQRRNIATRRAQVLSKLPAAAFRVVRQYQTVPYVAIDVGPSALAALERLDTDVLRVMDDAIVRPVLAESVPLVQGDQAWASGYDGSGTMIAVIDSGVDAAHPFLSGKVAEEACYSSTVAGTSKTFCPNGLDEQTGPGSAAPCSLDDCIHGTHVAGIAAGNGVNAAQSFSGVAPGARLMAVQVFSKITDWRSCGLITPCLGAYTSDVIAGLERVYAIAGQYNFASVNMSLGGGSFGAPCNDEPYKPIIDNLRSIGIATVVASGNDGLTSEISSPACISSAVSVGSTDKSDGISWFSNVAPFLSILAPGDSITSSVPGGSYEALSGTSMAAPHVAGAWSLMKEAAPSASVGTILTTLEQTGLPITDDRSSDGVTIPRVRALQALATFVSITSPSPNIAALSPSRVRGGIGPLSLTVLGTGFNAFSVVQWNGAARPTVVVSTTNLKATISAADLVTAGTAQVRVFNPAPGGGTSASLAFTIDPPPALTTNATAVAPGSAVTVTLTHGVGGSGDWIALAATGAPDASYLQWTYIGTGITDRAWTVSMPPTGGMYEFRLFLSNGYTRAATSPAVTVDPSFNPVPMAASLSPSTAIAGGPAFTLTVNGSNFKSSSVMQWNGASRPTTFKSSTQLQSNIGASDLATTGTARVTVMTPAPGGGVSAELTFAINAPPSLTVTATSVAPGANVTVTLANGIGGIYDWLALAATTAPNTSYIQYSYVGAGTTNRTWTVSMPTGAGTYEFRLFLNNGYTRAATSPTVTVTPGTNPIPSLSSLSPSGAVTGGTAFTLTLNGGGFSNASVVRWNGADRVTTFVSSAQVQAAIPATDLTVASTAQVTVFSPAPGGGLSSALPFRIGPPPTLIANPTSLAGGASATVTLTDGFGGSTDWLALAATTVPNTSYLQYTYVGAGVTARTWTVAMPSTAGTYEFRLFLNNGYTRVATSAPVTVTQGPNPMPLLSSLSPNAGIAGTTALTLTVNGSGFVPSSIVSWNGSNRSTTFVSATQLQASLSASDLANISTAQVTVFSPAPGGGTSTPLAFTIAPPPTLAVDATTVGPGASVTVTLTGGIGGSLDWLSFAAATAPNTSYSQYTYVGNGVTARTWTVTVPSTAGAYEFRLFLGNGFARAATSPTVTIVQ